MIKKQFIRNLIDELNQVNEELIFEGKKPLDICYLIAPIEQHIEKCKEFIEDITKHNYCINGYDEDTTGGYTNGRIRILIEKPEEEKESEYLIDAYYNYCYYIEFLEEQRHWGYCQCTPEDEGYNEKYDCCGNGCDWTAPAFRIYKEINLGYGSWEGMESDYWKYKEQFNQNEENNNKKVKEYIKQEERKNIENQIAKLKKRLLELDQE